jgi:inner membrane protein
MHKKGHYGAALLGYAPLGTIVLAAGFDAAALAGGIVTVALAMVPDLDMRLPGVSHRGPTHTVHFALSVGLGVGLLAGALVLVGDAPLPAAVGATVFMFATGALAIGSHIAADALTPMGVEPLGTGGPHYSVGVARAANPLANYGLLALGIVAVAAGVVVGEAVG